MTTQAFSLRGAMLVLPTKSFTRSAITPYLPILYPTRATSLRLYVFPMATVPALLGGSAILTASRCGLAQMPSMGEGSALRWGLEHPGFLVASLAETLAAVRPFSPSSTLSLFPETSRPMFEFSGLNLSSLRCALSFVPLSFSVGYWGSAMRARLYLIILAAKNAGIETGALCAYVFRAWIPRVLLAIGREGIDVPRKRE